MTSSLLSIAQQLDDGNNIGPADLESFCRLIDATGPLNVHLRFVPQPRQVERAIPVDANSQVNGDFLTIVYDAHWPRLLLNEHADRTEMGDDVLNNVLVGFEVFAFERGRRLRYRIDYDDKHGSRRIYHPSLPTPFVSWLGT